MNVRPESLFEDRYTILSLLGEGGFAQVFRAWDETLKRQVAIKIMKASLDHDSSLRFQREAKLLAMLSNPHTVSIYAFGLTADATPFIVMEYLKGSTLQQILFSRKAELPEICKLLDQCCAALGSAHLSGIIHRDLSSANIFLVDGTFDQIKLLDFGLAKIFNQGDSLTATGSILGNPLYVSPEVIKGQKADARSDIYALGCILYECLSGIVPFVADTPVGLLYLHRNELPAPLDIEKFSDKDTALRLHGISFRCIQKDPAARFQSCSEVIAALSEKNTIFQSSQFTTAGKNKKIAAKKLSSIICASIAIIVVVMFTVCLASSSFWIFATPLLEKCNSPQFCGVKEVALTLLLRNNLMPQADSLLDNLALNYSSNREFQKTADCRIRQLRLAFDKHDRRRIMELVAQMETLPGKSEKLGWVSRVREDEWKLLRAENSRHSDSLLLSRCCQVLREMIASKEYSNNQLLGRFQFCTKSFSILARSQKNPPDDSWRVFTDSIFETTVMFLQNVHVRISHEMTGQLGSIQDSLKQLNESKKAAALRELRIDRSETTGESVYNLLIENAEDLHSTQPQRAIAMIEQAVASAKNKGGKADILEALLGKCNFFFTAGKSEIVLRTADEALALGSTGADVGSWKVKNMKLQALFLLNRKDAMRHYSKELENEILEILASGDLGWQKSSLDQGKNMIHSDYFTCCGLLLSALYATNQIEELNTFLDTLTKQQREQNWEILQTNVIANLKRSFRNVKNDELQHKIYAFFDSLDKEGAPSVPLLSNGLRR